MGEIRVSPERLRAVASTLDEQQERLDELLARMIRTVDDLRGTWRGAAGADYIQAFYDTISPLRARMAETIEGLVADLRRIADEFERVDSEAVRRTGASKPPLFAWGPGDPSPVHPNDISQGALGDCYLVASLAAIALQRPDLIQQMVRDNGDGTYTVTFYQRKRVLGIIETSEFEAVNITVSAEDLGKGISPQEGDQGELWGAIVEKAYAEWKGGYKEIGEGGYPWEALEELTGVPSKTYSPQDLTITDLAQALEEDQAVAVATKHDWDAVLFDIPDITDSHPLYKNNELVSDHAYYVSRVDEENGLVYLRNPWGWEHPEVAIPFDEFKQVIARVDINPLSPTE